MSKTKLNAAYEAAHKAVLLAYAANKAHPSPENDAAHQAAIDAETAVLEAVLPNDDTDNAQPPKPAYIVLHDKETMVQSIVSDLTTFGLLILCLFLTEDHGVWSFIAAVMFVVFIFGRLSTGMLARHTFSTRAQFLRWAKTLEPNDKSQAAL